MSQEIVELSFVGPSEGDRVEADAVFLQDFLHFGCERAFWALSANFRHYLLTPDYLARRSLALGAFQATMDGLRNVATLYQAICMKPRGASIMFTLSSSEGSTKFLGPRALPLDKCISALHLEEGVARLTSLKGPAGQYVAGAVPKLPVLLAAMAKFAEYHRVPYNRLRHGNCVFSHLSLLDHVDKPHSARDYIVVFDTTLRKRSPDQPIEFRRHRLRVSGRWMSLLQQIAIDTTEGARLLALLAIAQYYPTELEALASLAVQRLEAVNSAFIHLNVLTEDDGCVDPVPRAASTSPYEAPDPTCPSSPPTTAKDA